MEKVSARLESGPNDTTRHLDKQSAAIITEISGKMNEKPFHPHPLFGDGHAQTLAAYGWPRRFLYRSHVRDEARIFEIEPGIRLLAHCRWQANRSLSPTLVLVHGLEGSSSSVYMLGTADKAFRSGFNALRLNMRNCGGTEHLAPTLYNSGLSGDLGAVLKSLIEEDDLQQIFLAGFSMSGNMALKLAGEFGCDPPSQLRGICAVSPSVDLNASANEIERRRNRIYQHSFLKSLRKRMKRKHQLYPEEYDLSKIGSVRTIRDFDELYTSVHGGYINAEDYYTRASALQFMKNICVPTLVIHAQNDPFIPFNPLRRPDVADNPCILLLTPSSGGHVGFLSAGSRTEDRFWAENRIVQFCKLVSETGR